LPISDVFRIMIIHAHALAEVFHLQPSDVARSAHSRRRREGAGIWVRELREAGSSVARGDMTGTTGMAATLST
jgi:hypothetical protein